LTILLNILEHIYHKCFVISCIALGYELDDRRGGGGSSPAWDWEFVSTPPRPGWFWGPAILVSNGYQGRGVKLTTHLHLVPRLRLCGATHSLPQYAFMAWCSVKAQGQLYVFTFYAYCDNSSSLSLSLKSPSIHRFSAFV